MRICFATEDFYPDFTGGQGIYGYHLVDELTKKGINITVLAERRGNREKFWAKFNNKTLVLFTPFCFSNQLLLALFEYLFFILKLKNDQFDILHANQLSGLFFSLHKPPNVKKVIISAHNTNYDMYQITSSRLKRLFYLPLIILEKMMYRRADGILFNSESERNALLKYYSIKHNKSAVAFLGKPNTTFTRPQRTRFRSEIRKKMNLGHEEKIVLYVGRLVKKKKVDILVQAINILHQENNKINCLIIGTGSLQKKLIQIAPPYVKILGFIKDTKPFFLASDIFVTTGVAEGGVALSALEAAHYELPLILSPSDAGVPILFDGQNGYRADPDNPKDIAQKIKKVLPMAETMGQESAKLVKPFTWEQTAEETINFYKLILEKPLDTP